VCSFVDTGGDTAVFLLIVVVHSCCSCSVVVLLLFIVYLFCYFAWAVLPNAIITIPCRCLHSVDVLFCSVLHCVTLPAVLNVTVPFYRVTVVLRSATGCPALYPFYEQTLFGAAFSRFCVVHLRIPLHPLNSCRFVVPLVPLRWVPLPVYPLPPLLLNVALPVLACRWCHRYNF